MTSDSIRAHELYCNKPLPHLITTLWLQEALILNQPAIPHNTYFSMIEQKYIYWLLPVLPERIQEEIQRVSTTTINS